MSVVEVAKKTSMPTYEVEMLAKVNNFSRKSASLKLESSALDKNIDEPVKVVPSKEESPVFANARASLASHQVASMKARDAYGIPSKSNLRRPR
ncbi:MAG: hypothetical protein II733_03645, partial [Succinivibrio sp.]|nr:hypothetical protein [Succinivibrio sp.]